MLQKPKKCRNCNNKVKPVLNATFNIGTTSKMFYTTIMYTQCTHCIQGGSVAEWLACWTQMQKGMGSNCCRDAVGQQS